MTSSLHRREPQHRSSISSPKPLQTRTGPCSGPAGSRQLPGGGHIGGQRSEPGSWPPAVRGGTGRGQPCPAAPLAALAWIRQANGDPARAWEAMGKAERAAPDPSVTGLVNPVPAQRARLLLPRPRPPRPPAGHGNAASRRTTSRPTPGSRIIWCWRRCCSRKMTPAGHSGCWSGCTRQRPPSAGRAASSRPARCGRSRSRPAATRMPRWTPWPGRSPWPAAEAMSGCSPTRARR